MLKLAGRINKIMGVVGYEAERHTNFVQGARRGKG